MMIRGTESEVVYPEGILAIPNGNVSLWNLFGVVIALSTQNPNHCLTFDHLITLSSAWEAETDLEAKNLLPWLV